MHTPKHIVAVEDNDADILLLRDALDRSGVKYVLTVFDDGESARAYLEADGLPDLLLMDINLPRVDGVALLEIYRTQHRLRAVPVLVWSSGLSTRQDEILAGYRNVRFVPKPGSLAGFEDLAGEIGTILAEGR